jgi:pimeloyl-ACP methyl ester carboxylesterase
VLAAALVLAGAIYQIAGTAADRRRHPPPGRMLDIGGTLLHFIDPGVKARRVRRALPDEPGTVSRRAPFCASSSEAHRPPSAAPKLGVTSGLAAFEASPSCASSTEETPVIFESGISATCLNWTEVRADVETFARACTYDRAWLGWSEPATSPRTTLAIIDDLHLLLAAAQIPRPCILVGHSFGGMLVRAYAAKYPADVAGLILVDPLSPSEWLNASPAHARMLRLGVKLSRRGAMLGRVGVVRAALALLMAGGRVIPQRIAKLTSGRGESVISRLVGEVRKMPPETWPMVRAHWCLPRSFLGMAEYLESLPASAAESVALGEPEAAIPITVLSASNSTPEQIKERDAWVHRSPRGRHILARKSGHWIQLDEPRLVVETIREMVDSIRPS